MGIENVVVNAGEVMKVPLGNVIAGLVASGAAPHLFKVP